MSPMTLLDQQSTVFEALQKSPKSLLDELRAGTGYAIAFGGQGEPWLPALTDLVGRFRLTDDLIRLVRDAESRLEPLASELDRIPQTFDPVAWVDTGLLGESAENDEAAIVPTENELLNPVLSVPGILLTQSLALRVLELQGLDVQETRPRAIIGHSQGALAVEIAQGRSPVDVLILARLVGAAVQLVGAREGLLGETMISVSKADPEQVRQILHCHDVAVNVRNGRRACVLSGDAKSLARAVAELESKAAADKALRERKTTGGQGFKPVIEPVHAKVAFHHPQLAPVADLVSGWANQIGLDAKWASDTARRAVVDAVDWVAQMTEVADSGAKWLLDLGPADLGTKLSANETTARGVGVVAITSKSGLRALTTVGAKPTLPTPWSAHLPKVVTLPDGREVIETAFTRATGKSPIVLAGMTPTTVDAKIVAAAANAGYWAELAGGGQVTEKIFNDRIDELNELLEPGVTIAFNSLLLDPYLWGLHLGKQRLVQKARSSGAPIDAVIVTAGVPEIDDAVQLIEELHGLGIAHVVFKPGTVNQVDRVLAIADAVREKTDRGKFIIQVEGGLAGGHHSWEDLDEVLLATYGAIRARDHVVLCVGGGIGTPEDAARYLTGAWALDHGQLAMPIDGVLVGTAAMAAAEATTSPEVKELLVATEGTRDWIGAGQATNSMASGRSQLGADLHEIDNTFSRTGRLLDEVAGDAEAVAKRHDEIAAALDRTAKPWFGDLTTMTYGALLERYIELAGLDAVGEPHWLDESWLERFHALVQRTEARLAATDRGEVPTAYPTPEDTHNGPAVLASLRETYADLDTVLLHPADRAFFVEVCRRPGKPVNFVPVIDADVRRWWRSDSLWQAHDSRYAADQVCVIPGPASVAGITRVDEPIAELLQRFEDHCVDVLLESGRAPQRVTGRRRIGRDRGPIELLLAAPDVVWAGRTVPNPVLRLAGTWIVPDSELAEHADSGAVLVRTAEGVQLNIPIDERREITIDFTLDETVAFGRLPVVSNEAAVESMTALVTDTVPGDLPRVDNGRVVTSARMSRELFLEHAAVVADPAASDMPSVPDALVGLTWPAVFALIADAKTASGDAVVEGMLDLVHLDHQIRSLSIPNDLNEEVEITAEVASVETTTAGRLITINVQIGRYAQLTERFLIRGRPGSLALTAPAPGGGAFGDTVDRPRRTRVLVTGRAPQSMNSFALVSGDLNPIHTSHTASLLAGLAAPIVHGMWTSAYAQQAIAAATGRRLSGWTAQFVAPVELGSNIEVRAERTGLTSAAGAGTSAGAEVLEVKVLADGQPVLLATARLEPPRTAYAFPGQGIQSKGMGMDGYQRCPEARAVWDRADRHTRKALGFSILTVVRDNPTQIVAAGQTHRHPDGVLYLTQFTQVAMAVLGAAQMAELRAAGAAVDDAVLAGHSVGEYNALAAVSGVISLEAVVEVVFQRGSVMHTLVPRDDAGRSNYRLAAIRPSQINIADDEVIAYVDSVAEKSGEFLQIVNHNLRGSQYAIAGTIAGLEALEADIDERRARYGGKAAFILVPGIDVPFHSRVLQDGVPDFRNRLDELLPDQIDPSILVGRYVPNLVPRPFSLEREFIAEIVGLVGTGPLVEVLADFDNASKDQGRLCRTVLIELLAWQFASPVRWIETQDLMFTPIEEGGLGVERFIEIGVGSAPTVANLAAGTLKAIGRDGIEVLNAERDMAIVFGTDEDLPEIDEPTDAEDTAETIDTAPVVEHVSAPSAGGSETQDAPDITFGPSDATRVLIAWWTKTRREQCGAADSIESLCDGASSRRNQLLVDLGAELSLGAIDGAADADLVTLGLTVDGLARTYRPFGPVLTAALGDHLATVFGPSGKRPAAIAERVTGVWKLPEGWVHHVTAELALATREGASVRGGDLGSIGALTSANDVDAAIDEAVLTVGRQHQIDVQIPQAGGGAQGAIDPAALEEFTSTLTGSDGVLTAAARLVLERLGHDEVPAELPADDHAAAVLERVETELGNDWIRATAPAFDSRKAVLFDDRWASAREDLARLAFGHEVPESAQFVGAGDAVAAQAEHWFAQTGNPRFSEIAATARDTAPGRFSDDVAVVTGASKGSIAAAIVAELLAGGATVVATSSRLDSERSSFYESLYRAHARPGAKLWVVPANMASFGDVDAFAEWVASEQTRTAAGATTVVKPVLTPTLLVPFAAGPAAGDSTEAGPTTELQTRILLWSVERLMGALAAPIRASDVSARIHVLLPGSPNRGIFGGDGAYGEAKAALDALVNKWSVERRWADRVTLTHAVIGWVRGTGLMGANDRLVAAVERAGIRTWSTEEMAHQLLAACTPELRTQALKAPVQVDLTGGLGDSPIDLAALATEVEPEPVARDDEPATLAALPHPPTRTSAGAAPNWAPVTARPEDLVVIVGAGELGPWGSARTRFEMEVEDRLSAAGVLELAWVTGLVTWDDTAGGWFDTESGDRIDEHEIAERYEEQVLAHAGIRRYEDDGEMVDNSAPLLSSVFLEQDFTFTAASKTEAEAIQAADPDRTRVWQTSDGDWKVTRLAGTEIRVPRRLELTRTVGGQVPTGFDPTRWGISAEMVESTDRVALWNLVSTVDAFLSSGFTPSELLSWVHPTRVANTQGTGMGGMTSMRSLYVDTLLGRSKPNDILQEALPNVIAAHVVQSYVGSYGAMVHPVAACATTAVSIEEGVDKIRLNKAEFVVAGGFDDLGIEGIVGFGDMSATADSAAMAAQGIDERHFSRANDRRYGGFVESQGGGTILLARGDVAARMGLPVLGVVAYAASFADGVHTSIPAPGLGALGAGLGGPRSALATSLAALGVSADDIAILSKHDTSTGVNERNESELHERLADAIGREEGNPLFVISQKTLTGHAKGGAAAFQVIGLCQSLTTGIVPPNRSLQSVMGELETHERLVWLREPLKTGPLKAGLVTSLGFGHVAGLIAVVHPEAFAASLPADLRENWRAAAERRELAGRQRLVEAMYGGAPLYERPADRRLGREDIASAETAMLLDPDARLNAEGSYV